MKKTKSITTSALGAIGKTATKTACLAVLAFLAAAGCLRADPMIQFDDLPVGLTQVPNGYHVLGWQNVNFINASTYSNNPSGLAQGMVSANNVIYGGGGGTASITAQMFDFISVYATAAFNDNLQLEAWGYFQGNLIYHTTNTLSATGPTLIPFGFYGVDEVDLTSYGGTHHSGYTGVGTQFVMDNLSVKTWLPYLPPLIVNGGFETGDLTGWSHTGNLGGTSVTTSSTYVHAGNHGLQIGPSVTPGYLSQTIHTQLGHIYDIDFYMENESAGVNSWSLSYANGVNLFTPDTNSPAFGWIHFLTGFRASEPTETISFQFINNPSYFGLDDISITDKSQQVDNGGFESGDFTWWAVWGNTNDTGVGSLSRIGTHGAYFGPGGSPGYVSPFVSVFTGVPYLVSFWLENPSGGTPNEYHASWTTVPPTGPAVTQALADQTNLPPFGWTNMHYTVIGDTYQNSLTFGFRNDPSFFFLDELSMWPVPLIQNGSFEFGDFTGWTTSGNFIDTSVSMSSGYANDGFYGARLGPVGSLGFLSQTITTVPGLSYVIRFEFNNTQAMTNAEFKVTWNGAVLMDTTNDTYVGWKPFEFVVAATGTNATLQFGFRDDPSYLGLDNVSVTPVQAPNIESITKNNSSANLSLNAVPEFFYQLQYTTNLTQPNWINIGSPLLPTGYPWILTDPNPTDKQRFYRVKMEPPQ